jgi:hypothetical protein
MSPSSELGLLSVAIAGIAYSSYMVQTLKRRARPHPFTWILFGVVTGTGYLIQVAQGAGPGSWVMGVTAAVCICLAIATLLKGEWEWSDFDRWDWLLLAVAIVVFIGYLTTKAARLSVCLATATDVIAYGPAIKLLWRDPWSDRASMYAWNSAKFIPSIFALQSRSIATVLYPATLVGVNAAVAALVICRRKYLVAHQTKATTA